jgi:hypothetical protein
LHIAREKGVAAAPSCAVPLATSFFRETIRAALVLSDTALWQIECHTSIRAGALSPESSPQKMIAATITSAIIREIEMRSPALTVFWTTDARCTP